MAQLRFDPSRQLRGAQCSGTLVLAKLGVAKSGRPPPLELENNSQWCLSAPDTCIRP
jgi:hypothetical protein